MTRDFHMIVVLHEVNEHGFIYTATSQQQMMFMLACRP